MRQMTAPLNGLRRDIVTIALICRDRRTPWHARLAAACCVGYVFSPIQLIPDWIPVLGLLDDAFVVALGVALLLKLTPAQVVAHCQERATGQAHALPSTRLGRAAAVAIVCMWFLLAFAGSFVLLHLVRR